MSHRLSQNARHTNDLLEELERDKELDVLREYIARFDLFPRTRDPASAPIRFEELKELVKHWKLHRQRNFWKTHTTKEDLVRTLYRHINTKIIPQESHREESNSAGGATSPSNASSAIAALAAAQPPSGIVPKAPERKPSFSAVNIASVVESPRSKSILIGSRLNQAVSKGPKKEHIFGGYNGDLFSQRGDYEDGMIYLSRFRKPGSIISVDPFESSGETNQDQRPDLDEEEPNDKSQELLDLAAGGLSREVRLKQECAFSIYHVRLYLCSSSTGIISQC